MRLLTNLKMNKTKTIKFSASINGILPSTFVQPLPHYPEKRERKVRWKNELVQVRFYKPERKVRWKNELVQVRFYKPDASIYYAGYIDDITCDIDVEMVDCFHETSTNMETSISQVDYHQKPRRRPIRRPITRSLSKRTRSGKLY